MPLLNKQKTPLAIFTLVQIFSNHSCMSFFPKLRLYHTNFLHTIVCLFKVTCFPLNYCKNNNLFLREKTTTQCRSLFFFLLSKLSSLKGGYCIFSFFIEWLFPLLPPYTHSKLLVAKLLPFNILEAHFTWVKFVHLNFTVQILLLRH